MRTITMLIAAGIAAVALPGTTALAQGPSQPQSPGGGQAPPNWGTVFANSMCASPAQVTFPGFQPNGDCTKY
jgi:hypothetical protein